MVTIKSKSILVIILGVSFASCTPQRPARTPQETTPKVESVPPVRLGNTSRFERTLALTTLDFAVDDCLSNLNATYGLLDNITARTQRNRWDQIKDRYEELITQCENLQRRWVEIETGGAQAYNELKREATKEKLTKLRTRLQEIEHEFEQRKELYLRARQEYENRKKEYFYNWRTALQAGREPSELSKGRFYENDNLVAGVSAVEFYATHVLVTLEAYAKSKDIASARQRLSSLKDLESQVRLVDSRGQTVNRAVETQYDRLDSVDGLIVVLAYEWTKGASAKPAEIILNPSVFQNHQAVVIPLDSDRSVAQSNKPPDPVAHYSLEHEGQLSTPGRQQNIIRCQRQGMHLRVPVVLGIHGVEVRTTMLLDTGASLTVLAKSLYSQGLAKPLDSLPKMQLKTANGMISCPVDRIAVSTTAFSKTIPVVLSKGSTSLLGANYFAGRRFTVDLRNKRIVVEP